MPACSPWAFTCGVAPDLASGKLPDYSFVTPNLCNDVHNCSLSVAEAWLMSNIGPLLTSTPFKDDGVLIIVFDESSNDDTHGGGRIAAVIISPKFSKVGYQSTTLYQHESTLRLMLEGSESPPTCRALRQRHRPCGNSSIRRHSGS